MTSLVNSPKINTKINFSMTCVPFNHNDIANLRYLYTSSRKQVVIPESFSWHIITSNDSQEIIKKKKLITKPQNQYLCGSCWAIATTTCIADKFVVSGITDWNPDLSTTYVLSNFSQGKCDGGDPVTLLYDIGKNGGIPSKHCIDYSWCSKNPECSGEATAHFGQRNLSDLVPKKGCYFDNEYLMYSIDKNSVKTIVFDTTTKSAVTIVNIQKTIQEHILVHGPVIAGFLVFKNFISGKFTKNNGGIYLEKMQENGTFSSNTISTENFVGGHAVVVVGWGLGKNIKIGNMDNDYASVPYWICRNSWGTSWGDGGFFKIAMFPFNRKVQFSQIVQMANESGVTLKLGGVLTFSLAGFPKKKFIKSTEQRHMYELEQDNNWYKDMVLGSELSSETSNHLTIYMLCVIGALLLIVGILKMKIT